MNMDSYTFDTIVIGGGLIGSACAKYLSLENRKVALIGPEEPTCRADTNIFACWHDEGRLYHWRDSSSPWGILTRKTIERFQGIENESGIQFQKSCGYLALSGPKYRCFQEWLNESLDFRDEGFGEILNADSITKKLPFMMVDEESIGCYEPPGCYGGYLSPRKLVAAQKQIASNNGCVIVSEVAHDLGRSDDDQKWVVTTDTGVRYKSEKVVLCQGTYLGLSPLIKQYLPALDVWYTAQTIALIQVDQEEANRLSQMPSMVVQVEPKQYTYILPPIVYPDGYIYIKFGQHDLSKKLETQSQVTEHYRSGPDPRHVRQLVDEALKLLPGLRVISFHGDSCVTLNTPTKKAPFIDTAMPGLVIAGAGCGHGAMSSDEIGKVAAELSSTGKWTSELEKEECRLLYRHGSKL